MTQNDTGCEVPPEQQKKKHAEKALLAVGCGVLAWVLLALGGLLWFKWNYLRTETKFTPERITELEERFDLSLSDVNVEKYKTASAAGDVFDELWLSGIADPADFMAEHVRGQYALTDENCAAGSRMLSYSGKDTEICTAKYSYDPAEPPEYGLINCDIAFFAAEDGSYRAKVYVSKW